jgi:hypothetical protein
MKNWILTIILATPFSAFSETLVCQFTEPFFTVTYDTDTNIIGYQSFEGINFTDLALVKFEKGGFEVSAADKELKLFIDLTKTGSDGMSDIEYLYEGRVDKFFGGCSPAKK